MGDRTTTYDIVTRYVLDDSGYVGKLASIEKALAQAAVGGAKAEEALRRIGQASKEMATMQAEIRRVGNSSREIQRVSTELKQVTKASQETAKATQEIVKTTGLAETAFRRLGLAMGAYFTAGQAKTHLIGYNSYMEQSRLQMAGLMAQAGSGEFMGNLPKAAELMRQMRDDAAKTVGTTQDYVQMASMLVQPLTMAGGTVKDIREVTRLAVVASKAMGIDAATSARDIDQAIRGVYRSVDQFTGKLLTPMGYGGEEGRRKFNALSMEQRYSELRKSLSSRAIEQMAQAQENTYEGQASTFESRIKEFMGYAGEPLFKSVTEQLKQWNDWLSRNESKIKEVAETIGKDIVTALNAVKDVTIFLHDHWKELAMMFVSIKAPGAIAGIATGIAGGLGTAGAAGALTGAGGLAAALSGATIAVGTFAAAVLAAQTYMEQRQQEGLEMASQYGVGVKGGTIDAFIESMGRYRGAKTDAERKSAAQQVMALGKNQGIRDQSSLENAAGYWSSDQRMAMARAMGIDPNEMSNRGTRMQFGFVSAKDIAQAIDESKLVNLFQDFDNKLIRMWDPSRGWFTEQSDLAAGGNDYPGYASWINPKKLPTPDKATVNIHINRIEVVNEDPDRWVVGLENLALSALKNPSSARTAIREG